MTIILLALAAANFAYQARLTWRGRHHARAYMAGLISDFERRERVALLRASQKRLRQYYGRDASWVGTRANVEVNRYSDRVYAEYDAVTS